MCLVVPGQILSIGGAGPSAHSGQVSFGEIVREVNLACVPDAQVGDYVIVHAGLALRRVDAQEAQRVLAYLAQIDDLTEWPAVLT